MTARKIIGLIITILLGIVCQLYFVLPLQESLSPPTKLAITATINSTGTIEIYANGKFERSYSAPIEAGVEKTYFFDGVPAEINFLRIDPTDIPNTNLAIKKIELFIGGKSAGVISSEELLSWQLNGLEKNLSPNPEFASFTSSTNDPMLINGALKLGSSFSSRPSWFVIVLPLLPLLLAMLALFFGRGAIFAWVAVILYFFLRYLAKLLTPEILDLPAAAPNPEHVLGYVAYAAYSKSPERIAFFALVFVSLSLGLLAGLVIRRTSLWSTSWLDIKIEKPRLSSIWILFALFFVLTFPPLHQSVETIRNVGVSVGDFDLNNVFTWDYLAQTNKLPYRDYWFPYAGDYNQLGYFPQSLVQTFIVRLILAAALLFSFYELCGRRLFTTIVVLLPLAFLIETNIFQGTKRYLLAASVFSMALAVFQHEKPSRYAAVIYGIFVGWGFTREPGQLVYALPGVMLILAFKLFDSIREKNFRCYLSTLTWSAAGLVVALSVHFLFLIKNAQLPGFIKFFSELSAFSGQTSKPARLLDWLDLSTEYEDLLFLGLNLTLSLGIFLFVVSKDRRTRLAAQFVLGMSVVGAMVFLKMLVRPTMAQQVLVFVYLALSFYIIFWASYWRYYQKLSAFFIFGLVLGHTYSQTSAPAVIKNRLATIGKVDENLLALKELPVPPEEIRRYFSFENFQGLDADQRATFAFISTLDIPPQSRNLFVLGDDSYFYAGLNLISPPYISIYDGSNIWAQKTTINWITENQPQYVVWNTAALYFDGVPNLLRSPLIYNYIIMNYTEFKSFGRISLLRKRQPNEPFSWEYWLSHLGTTLDLGRLPELTNYDRFEKCKSKGDCVEFLKIAKTTKKDPPKKVELKINSHRLVLNFQSSAKNHELIIPLYRIWFWHAAKENNLQPEIFSEFEVKLKEKQRIDEILY